MPDVTVEILIILLLLVANGYLALSEIAIVSARRTRLLHSAERGDRAAAVAAELSASPTKFLSTVQVGITLIGILSGAFGGATLAEELIPVLAAYPALAPHSEGIAVAVVVVAIAYLSVIVGELVPKRIALSNPERFARWVARPMRRLSRIAAPAVAALETTSNVVIRILRVPTGGDAAVTEADVSAMIAAGTAAGVFAPVERRMVEQVFRLDDEPVAALMTPRTDIVWLDVNDPREVHEDVIARYSFSLVVVRDLWVAQRMRPDAPPDLRAALRQPLFVPERTPALGVLQQFQSSGTHVAIVIDEHGGVDGLLTLNNVLTFLVAAPGARAYEAGEPGVVQREDGSWLVDGVVSLGDLYAAIGMDDPEADVSRPYHTVAGLVLSRFGRMPATGDRVTAGELILEVADMDHRRVDKVLVTRHSPRAPGR
jgi:putative hemolysin